jgi:glucose-1-phosphate thymidylyltransferase
MAKPLLPIRGRPIVEYIVANVQLLEEITQIFIVTNHRFYKDFKEWVDNFANTVPVELIDDGSHSHKEKLGAVRDLALVLEEEDTNDDLLVIGGDNLFSFTLDEFVDFAKKVRPSSLIGIYNLNGKLKPNKFGVVKLDKQSKVMEFYEKPQNLNGHKLVSMCLYFFPKEKTSLIREYIKEGNNLDKIGSYIQWLSKKDTVYGYSFEGDWFDIGDIDSYTEAVFTF